MIIPQKEEERDNTYNIVGTQAAKINLILTAQAFLPGYPAKVYFWHPIVLKR